MYTHGWLSTSLAAQGILLAVILLALPTRQRLANRLLAVLVLTFSARLVALQPIAGWPGLMLLHNTAFLLGPLLWLYARALSNPSFRLRAAHAWHAAPALLAVSMNLVLLPDYRRALDDPILIRASFIHGIAASGSMVAYGLLILGELNRYRGELRDFYGNLEGIGLRWLQILVWLVLLAAGASAAINLMRFAGWSALNPVSLVVLPASVLLVYAVALFGFRQSRIISPLDPTISAIDIDGDKGDIGSDSGVEKKSEADGRAPDADAEPAADSERAERSEAGRGKEGASGPEAGCEDYSARYQRSGLDRARMERLWLRLDSLVARERLWLDPELDLGRLAERLDVAPQNLSQVFNDYAGLRFYDYINRLRVVEAQRLLRDPARAADPILDIALAAGFSTKSTFNKYFRNQTGLTPTAWRRQ